jgi:DNA (cytosine-5)-methyltransferase 1
MSHVHNSPFYFASGRPRTKAVTLFSGVGSSSLALDRLGYYVLPHDLMPEAVETLLANGFTEARCIDVREIDYSDPRYEGTEIVVGGPPCQPFSQAHEGDGQYDKRDMIPEFIRAVASLLPSIFVMEEVQTLTWAKHKDYLARVEDDLRALGYRVEHKILNAAKHGGAQARKRLFVVGVAEDIAQAIEEFGRTYSKAGLPVIAWPEERPGKTMGEALGWTRATAWVRNQQCPEPARIASDDPRLDWVFERPAPTVVGSFRPDVAASPGYRKAGDGPRQNQPGSVSTTLEERLILQDLPVDWKVCGSEAKQALQVGNSVPCDLITDLIDINIP